MRPREQGQALLELVIVLPLFVALLLAASIWADLMLKKMDLIQLTRNFAVILARSAAAANATDLNNDFRNLANQTTRLDSRRLKFSLHPLPPTLLQGQDPSAAEAMSLPGVGGVVQGILLGQRLEVTYAIEFRGMLGMAMPSGLVLRETVALKTDPWTNLGDRLLKMLGVL